MLLRTRSREKGEPETITGLLPRKSLEGARLRTLPQKNQLEDSGVISLEKSGKPEEK